MKIKELRERTKLNQTTTAKKIGIPRVNYNKYENEEIEPNIETLCKLADYFNVSLDYLCGRTWNNNAYLEVWKLTDEQKANLYLIEQLNKTNNLIANGYLLRLFQEQQKASV